MNIVLYEAEDVVSRKGGSRKSGARYAKYAKPVGEHLDWLFEQIDASKDKTIRIKLSEFAKECGFTIQKVVNGKAIPGPGLNPTSVTWAFKYVLFHAGIMTRAGKVGDGQPIMIMTRKTEDDTLPASLQDDIEVTESAEIDESTDSDEAGREDSIE